MASKDQWWYCWKCKKKTVHEINQTDIGDGPTVSDWSHYEGIRGERIPAWMQTRWCSECESSLNTVIIAEETLEELLKVAKTIQPLRAFQDAVEAALRQVQTHSRAPSGSHATSQMSSASSAG